jgi:hypothetical protein
VAYDSGKDVLLLEREQEHLVDASSWLTARAMSYDGAPPRYSIVRVGKKASGEMWFRDAGRMTLAEVEWAISALQSVTAAEGFYRASKTRQPVLAAGS